MNFENEAATDIENTGASAGDRIQSRLLSKLAGLTPVRRYECDNSLKEDDFFFTLTRDVLTGVWLSVTDRDGHPVSPAQHCVTGASRRVLEAIGNSRFAAGFDTGWHDAEETRINLRRNPAVTAALVDCRNVRLADGTPVTCLRGDRHLNLDLEPFGTDSDSEGNQGETQSGSFIIVPQILSNEETGDKPVIVLPSDIISANAVLKDSVLYEITPLGDNISVFDLFELSVPRGIAQQWLSVFFSYVENVTASVNGVEIPWNRNSRRRVRTLLFTEVDSDKSLHMEVAHLIPELDPELQQRLPLTVVATADEDGSYALARVESDRPDALEEDSALVYSMLRKNAPGREAAKEVFRDGAYFIVPPEVAGPFLLHGLPFLLRDFNVIGSEKLSQYKIRTAYPKIKVKFTSSGIDFLDTETEVTLGDEKISLADLLRQYSKNRFVQLSGGDRAILDDRFMNRLARIFRISGKGKDQKVKVSYFDIPEVESLLRNAVKGEAPKRYRRFLEGYNRLSSQKFRIPGLKADLRPYQRQGVKWMKYLYDNGMGGCLADDMGLGKTVQTIAMLSLIYSKKEAGTRPTLIVMPKSLLFNWESEFDRFAPGISVYTYYNTSRDLDEAAKADVVITTYGTLRSDIDAMRRIEWEYAILDESQNIKNLTSQTAKAAFLLNAEHKLALSGTPMENNVMELYSLFRFLNPTMLGDEADFQKRYAFPIQNASDRDAAASLRRKIYPFMLRRLKKEVLHDLPDITEQVIYAEMEPEQARIYEERRKYYKGLIEASIHSDGVAKSQFVMFQALSELRRLASIPGSLTDGEVKSPKLDPLVETLADATANGHKCVVFFNFLAGIEMVGTALEHMGIDYATMTGSTTDRSSVVERFRKDPGCRVLLLTLKVGGVGLNLTAADMVFIFEPWWNRAAEQQAIDRLHRIGQTTKVSSFSLITKNTIEERIRQLQQQKSDLFKDIISSDSTLSKHISEADIDFMLS